MPKVYFQQLLLIPTMVCVMLHVAYERRRFCKIVFHLAEHRSVVESIRFHLEPFYGTKRTHLGTHICVSQ